ncbi:hypothetical protein GCM10009850_039410 [Nonomuraea monospora]|uniref:SGNH hydrolase-type esterase domain-containing protein n=1 Tax=Nonomuraea monospora TaxID=568818 RepID=A0ABN3CH08_9ACTN
MKRPIIITLSLVLAAALCAAGTVAYLTFLRPADNPPADACAAEGARPRVVAAGASMTQGSLGADWVGSLRAAFPAYEFVNAGSNGNTTADLLERVDSDIVACRPAAVTLLIGTNDVRNSVPLDDYRANLRAIVDRVKSGTGARVALMSLPPLGENLDAPINRTLTGYNAAVKDVAAQTGSDYLPLHERMADVLRHGARTSYGFSFPLAFTVAAQHYLLRRTWDEIARSGGRELLVDHVHLTDRGGAIVTELASGWLTGLAKA